MGGRYRASTDRLVNRLVPHYLGGRRFVLIVQSLLYPLQGLSDRFVAFAAEKHIEARMTSQVMYFEWYLNRLFIDNFYGRTQRITLEESPSLGVDLYHQGTYGDRAYTVFYQGEQVEVDDPEEQPRPMYLKGEEKAVNQVSFMVNVPRLSIPESEIISRLTYVIERYRTAGKTYLIRIEQPENEQ